MMGFYSTNKWKFPAFRLRDLEGIMTIRNIITGKSVTFSCLVAAIIISSTICSNCYAETSYAGALITDSGISETASVLSENNNIINVNTAAPDLFTGTMSYKIPITVPTGRGGMQPDLSLTYRSSNGNGWAGMGWALDVGSIERNTRSGVNYNAEFNADNYVVLRKSGSVSELINIGNADYRAKIEGEFNRIVRLTDSDGKPYWEAIDKKGTHYFFGQTTASRQDNPADSSQIFKWCLDRVVDTNGNAVTFSYSKTPGGAYQGEIYLSQISYNGNVINFYLDGTRMDLNEIYTTNFPVKTAYRLKTIDILANGNRVRTYKLNYKDGEATSRSLLTGVVQYDKNANVDASTILKGDILNAAAINNIALFNAQNYGDSDIYDFNESTALGDLVGIGWVDSDYWISGQGSLHTTATHITGDFNGDGKTDILKLEQSIPSWNLGGSNQLAFSNGNGTFTVSTPTVVDEADFKLSLDWVNKGIVSAGDFNGDGKTDLFLWRPDGANRILHSNGDGTFASRRLSDLTRSVPV